VSAPLAPLVPFLIACTRRQLLLAFRRPLEIANPLLFFLLVVLLFPLGIGPNPQQLAQFAPGILWIVALLATLMAAEGLFRVDFDDGTLEQLLLAPQPLYLSCLSYVLAHWLLTGLPLTLLAPLFAVMLQLPGVALPTLMLSLLLGTAVLSLVGSIGAALTVGLKRGGMLISLLIIPFYLPVLIFGSGAVQFATLGHSSQPQLLILAGMLSLAVALAPFAIAAGLRISVDAG
jgi:heme exporter protein B